MRILELVPSLASGGGERFVIELSNEMATRKKIEVLLGQINAPTSVDALKETVSEMVHHVSFGKGPGLSFKVMLSLYFFIKKNKIDIVHSNLNATNYILLSALLCRRVKFFVTIHSEAQREAGGVLSSLIRKTLFNLNLSCPVTISKESNVSFINYYKRTAPIIFNGCSPYQDKGLENPFKNFCGLVFLHIARTHQVKNQEMLYRCFQRMIDEGQNVYLIHIGRFCNDEISNKLRKYKSDRIRIMGELRNIRDYLKYADAFCLSSFVEGMPMTIIEAFSVSCPVISTPVGGCKYMIDNTINGILSDDITEDSYYKALKRFVLMSDDERKFMRNNAKKSFEKYSIKNVADNYLKLFKR